MPHLLRQERRKAGSFRGIFATDRPLFLGTFPFAASELVEEHGASYGLVGALSALFAIGSVSTSRLLPRFAANTTDALRFRCGATVMAAGFALLATSPGPELFGLAVFVFGVGFTLAHSTLQARTTEVSPGTRGIAVSLFAGLANVGSALGTFAAGAIIDQSGFGAAFAVATVGLLVLATVGPAALRQQRRGADPPDTISLSADGGP